MCEPMKWDLSAIIFNFSNILFGISCFFVCHLLTISSSLGVMFHKFYSLKNVESRAFKLKIIKCWFKLMVDILKVEQCSTCSEKYSGMFILGIKNHIEEDHSQRWICLVSHIINLEKMFWTILCYVMLYYYITYEW